MSGAFGLARALIQGITTGSARQIIWPLVDQLGEPLTNVITGLSGGQALLDGVSALGVVNGLGGYVAILEEHYDESEITSHPVEQGATVSDHAYELPSELMMQLGWSTSASINAQLPSLLGVIGQPLTPLDVASFFTSDGQDIFIRQVYNRLLALKAQRTLLTIYTGKRVYNDMLIRSISERTTSQTEHALIVTVSLKQIIRAQVQTLTVPTNPNAQALPQDTTPTIPQGPQQPQPAPNYNPSPAPETIST